MFERMLSNVTNQGHALCVRCSTAREMRIVSETEEWQQALEGSTTVQGMCGSADNETFSDVHVGVFGMCDTARIRLSAATPHYHTTALDTETLRDGGQNRCCCQTNRTQTVEEGTIDDPSPTDVSETIYTVHRQASDNQSTRNDSLSIAIHLPVQEISYRWDTGSTQGLPTSNALQ